MFLALRDCGEGCFSVWGGEWFQEQSCRGIPCTVHVDSKLYASASTPLVLRLEQWLPHTMSANQAGFWFHGWVVRRTHLVFP